MTAAGTSAPSRPSRLTRRPPPAGWRLLRLELRRSTMLWMLPLLAVLLAFTELRNDLSHPPLWAVRSTDLQVQVELTGAIVAGLAAWTATRDGRRHVTDLVTATPRPQWIRQLASWAAVTIWGTLFYATCVAVVFVATIRQATWGGPIWWLPGVGAAAIVAFSALGYAVGAFLPGRFTAPLVTVGALLVPQIGVLALQRHLAWGWVSPARDATEPGTGIFFPFHPGLSIVQIMFLAGMTAVALGVLALPAAAGGRRLRRAGAIIALAGLTAACTGVALAGTARQGAQGVIIPALHDAASDKLITYTPACDTSPVVPVCVHPAFRAQLPGLAAYLDPALRQVAGLPGAPVRVQFGPGTLQDINGSGRIPGPAISGSPPVLYLSPSLLIPAGTDIARILGPAAAVTIIQNVIYGRPAQGGPAPSPAQQAVEAALLKAVGVRLLGPTTAGVRQFGNGVPGPPPGSPALAAAHRFAALPAAARHAWLAAHLAALRAGRITLAELP
jgi:hypothetical protein